MGKLLHATGLFVGTSVFFAPEILNFENLAHSGLWKLSHGGVFKDETLEQTNKRLRIDEDFSLQVYNSPSETSMNLDYKSDMPSSLNEKRSD